MYRAVVEPKDRFASVVNAPAEREERRPTNAMVRLLMRILFESVDEGDREKENHKQLQ